MQTEKKGETRIKDKRTFKEDFAVRLFKLSQR